MPRYAAASAALTALLLVAAAANFCAAASELVGSAEWQVPEWSPPSHLLR